MTFFKLTQPCCWVGGIFDYQSKGRRFEPPMLIGRIVYDQKWSAPHFQLEKLPVTYNEHVNAVYGKKEHSKTGHPFSTEFCC